MNADQLRESAQNGIDSTVEHLEDAAELAKDAFARGKEQLQEVQEQALKCAKEGTKSADRYVRDNPWQAVGVAAAIGLIAGLLIRRR
jgi:ElaB/YqjD/DUF883 family membrane-anchored ribosome-binding protein